MNIYYILDCKVATLVIIATYKILARGNVFPAAAERADKKFVYASTSSRMAELVDIPFFKEKNTNKQA